MSKADRERGFDLREIVRGLRSSHGSPLVARKLFKLVHGGCEETRERERERDGELLCTLIRGNLQTSYVMVNNVVS